MSYELVRCCRSCGSEDLRVISSFQDMALSGTFAESASQNIISGPLTVVMCANQECGLVQLEESYNSSLLYSDNYGYRSGLNASMLAHLKNSVESILNKYFDSSEGPLTVLDVGSNDGSLLGFYPEEFHRVGIDPTISKFGQYYKDGIRKVPKFFNKKTYWENAERPADIITSFSMFYDLNDPVGFMKDVEGCLSENGIWVCEQSYLPSMVETLSFDTICHEHIEYYCLKQFLYMAEKAALRIVDVETNLVNGGSFKVFLCKKASPVSSNTKKINEFLNAENAGGFHSADRLIGFFNEIDKWRDRFLSKLEDLAVSNTVYGLGASTKGNTLLQYCSLDGEMIESIGEVNPDKFGKFTPGNSIPIVSEDEILSDPKGVYLVLPWHFRDNFLKNRKYAGKRLLFPLPTIEIVVPA